MTMLAPAHAILASQRPGMTPRRAMIIGGVGLLHVAAIYGLMHGMVGKAIQILRPPIEVVIDKPVAPKPVPIPPQPKLVQPTVQPQQQGVIKPEIEVASTEPPPFTGPPATLNPPTPIADSGALGLTSSHTTPPYPDIARRLSHQGTVLLQMVVTPQGDVASAQVVNSSGFAELDQAAIAWVISHWKYKPAIQNGVAVPSETKAAVKFDLKTARG